MVQTNTFNLQEGIDYKLLDDARMDKGWTVGHTAEEAGVPEGTTKKILNGDTLNPGAENLGKLCRALGVPMEKVLRQEEKKEIENQGIKDNDASILALKEIYEMQNTALKETNEAHIANIRHHYEQHHEDLKDNYEKRLSDKREMIELLKMEVAELKVQLEKQEKAHKAEIESLKIEHQKKEDAIKLGIFIRNIIIGLFVIGVIVLLVLEFMHPEHGWIRMPAHSQHTHYFGLATGISALALIVFGVYKSSVFNKNKKRG